MAATPKPAPKKEEEPKKEPVKQDPELEDTQTPAESLQDPPDESFSGPGEHGGGTTKQ